MRKHTKTDDDTPRRIWLTTLQERKVMAALWRMTIVATIVQDVEE